MTAWNPEHNPSEFARPDASTGTPAARTPYGYGEAAHSGPPAPYQQPVPMPHSGANPHYGPPTAYPGYPATHHGYAQPAPSNGLGVAGFVTGLIGLILFWVPLLGAVLAILGVVLGGVGISSGRKRGAGIGLAVSGLVLGIIALVPALLIVIGLLAY